MIDNFYKILCAAIPVYFYFVPTLLLPRLYDKYVKNTYKDMKGGSLNAYEEIKNLKENTGRVISFISFISIYVATIIVLLFSEQFYRILSEFDKIGISLIGFFIVFGGIVIRKNIMKKKVFRPKKNWVSVEAFCVFLSFAILGFVI